MRTAHNRQLFISVIRRLAERRDAKFSNHYISAETVQKQRTYTEKKNLPVRIPSKFDASEGVRRVLILYTVNCKSTLVCVIATVECYFNRHIINNTPTVFFFSVFATGVLKSRFIPRTE